MRSLTPLVLAAALLCPALPGQAPYPRQTPYPGQGPYPQGGPYPDQYPYPQGGPYPARLPGGVPIGIPMPEIKLPKRKPKDAPGQATGAKAPAIPWASVAGTLRKFGAKDLVLEAPKAKLLRFRLLAKTEFRDKADKPVRDSLLRPGDRLIVQLNSDDPETALRVVLDRPGTAAERASAAKPFDENALEEPQLADVTPMKSAPVMEEAAAAAGPGNSVPPTGAGAPEEATPTLRRTPDGVPQAEASTPLGSAHLGQAADPIIQQARAAADAFMAAIPNFLVSQSTTRYVSQSIPASWRAVDIVTADVASSGGQEEYKNIRINGQPTNRPMEQTGGGAWSTGEFVTTMQDVLSPATNARFTRRSDVQLGNRTAHWFDFSVEQQNSHWRIVAPGGGQSFSPAYTGGLWIDKETKRVLKIEMKAHSLPSAFPWDRVESSVEYGFVMIDGRSFLLPTESTNSGCAAGTLNCSRNVIVFRNYRKFGADSTIVFDKLVARN